MRTLIPLFAVALLASCASSKANQAGNSAVSAQVGGSAVSAQVGSSAVSAEQQPQVGSSAVSAQVGSSAVSAEQPEAVPAKAPERVVGGEASYIPRALIYRTNGDYADNVPITVNAAGDQVVSFPAPSDLRGATPVPLADGWLLDRRGVSLNTRFTTFTYKEYSEMTSAPSIERLLHSVIPGARVTEVKRLDMTTQQALADTAAINVLIRNLSH